MINYLNVTVTVVQPEDATLTVVQFSDFGLGGENGRSYRQCNDAILGNARFLSTGSGTGI